MGVITHPLNNEIMKYLTASYVRDLVYALSVEGHNEDIGCSCIQRVDDKDQWECHLYSIHGFAHNMDHLLLLVLSLVSLCPTLCYHRGHYAIGRLKGENNVESIVVW